MKPKDPMKLVTRCTVCRQIMFFARERHIIDYGVKTKPGEPWTSRAHYDYWCASCYNEASGRAVSKALRKLEGPPRPPLIDRTKNRNKEQ